MQEREIRGLISKVKEGSLSRRSFMQKMLAVGVTGPLVSQMLVSEGVAQTGETPFKYKPTKAGGGGALKLLFWQAPTLLNPHFAVGSKDQEASRIFYEPLAGWDGDGNLTAILASELPTVENGGLAKDLTSVTWKLKKGVTWHDGMPFTADDCVFTWEYAKNPDTAAYTIGTYKDVKVEKIDELTVKVIFPKPQPFWADAFVGTRGMILPKHLMNDYVGAKSRDAPTNLKPVGTGPYQFVEFKPGDIVKGEIFKGYHVANRPHFDTIEMKGGGDAVSAARAVLQTGEYDYGWNLQVEDEILLKLEAGGKGRIAIVPGGSIEHIQLNSTDPWTDIDGERSSVKTKHPTLSDPAVRQAMALLLDRGAIQKFIYGRTGVATPNFLNNPERFRSKDTSWEFSIEKANALLDKAGWVKGSDGIRAKDGKKLKFVYQTSINAPRQKTQAIYKQACQKAGIDLELKSIVASVYFSSDVANPDTYPHFYTDIQMYNTTMTEPDPAQFMQQFCSWEASQKDNKWQGRNITRWKNEEYDAAYKASTVELDPVKRAALFAKMNSLAVNDQCVIAVAYRPTVPGMNLKLQAPLSGWDNNLWLISDWYKDA